MHGLNIPYNLKSPNLTNIHDQVPDQDDPSPDCAIYVPKPEAEENGVVSLIAQLGSEEK